MTISRERGTIYWNVADKLFSYRYDLQQVQKNIAYFDLT
jgi:hypothetical protein